MQFDYFYGDEAEQFTFYKIPKVLITSQQFKKVSDSAKLLYGLMLDRMGLSIRNGWFDEQNRTYIFFTVNDIMEQMNCKTEKATKLVAELSASLSPVLRLHRFIMKMVAIHAILILIMMLRHQ